MISLVLLLHCVMKNLCEQVVCMVNGMDGRQFQTILALRLENGDFVSGVVMIMMTSAV